MGVRLDRLDGGRWVIGIRETKGVVCVCVCVCVDQMVLVALYNDAVLDHNTAQMAQRKQPTHCTKQRSVTKFLHIRLPHGPFNGLARRAEEGT